MERFLRGERPQMLGWPSDADPLDCVFGVYQGSLDPPLRDVDRDGAIGVCTVSAVTPELEATVDD